MIKACAKKFSIISVNSFLMHACMGQNVQRPRMHEVVHKDVQCPRRVRLDGIKIAKSASGSLGRDKNCKVRVGFAWKGKKMQSPNVRVGLARKGIKRQSPRRVRLGGEKKCKVPMSASGWLGRE